MLRINSYENLPFKMKNNKVAAQKALEKTAPELKQEIYRGINAFCDATQRKGIKGMGSTEYTEKMVQTVKTEQMVKMRLSLLQQQVLLE